MVSGLDSEARERRAAEDRAGQVVAARLQHEELVAIFSKKWNLRGPVSEVALVPTQRIGVRQFDVVPCPADQAAGPPRN